VELLKEILNNMSSSKNKVKNICEYKPCNKDAKYTEASGDGRLVIVCLIHRRLLRRQKYFLS